MFLVGFRVCVPFPATLSPGKEKEEEEEEDEAPFKANVVNEEDSRV